LLRPVQLTNEKLEALLVVLLLLGVSGLLEAVSSTTRGVVGAATFAFLALGLGIWSTYRLQDHLNEGYADDEVVTNLARFAA
jgi:hypothetical protein